jgi:hypothetical protein
MKKRGEGVVVRTVGSDIYDYAVSMDEGNFLITNGDEEIREEDIGKRIIVNYEPEWPCCQFVCFYSEDKKEPEVDSCDNCVERLTGVAGSSCDGCPKRI